MHVKTYDSVNGNVIASPAQELSFGSVVQGQHCPDPLVLRTFPDTEVTISDLKLFLESKDGWEDAEFGYHTDSSFTPSIESGSTVLSNHFTESPDATSTSPFGVSIGLTDRTSDYVWLDIDVPFSQTGIGEPNYRFTFNFT